MKIKTLRSDRGGEFTSDEFTNYCLKYGIQRQLTAPYSPQQNGVVERKNRTVVSMVRAMLKAKDLPRELWGEAVSTAVYILNRSSSKTLQGQTPYEMWTGRKPSVDHMKSFGSIAHVKVTKGHLSKLEDRSQPMIFIGYELGTKAYKCFDPVNSKVIISRDAIFEENEKWTWSTQEEEASTEVNSSSNVSGDMHSPRYRSLTDLYSETSPITQDEEAHLISGSSSAGIEKFKDEMTRKFDMSDLGFLSSYLGIEVKQGKKYIFLSQTTYAHKLLQHAKLEDCNAVATPLEARGHFTLGEGKSTVNSTTYRSLIGSLRYLTHTRPDLLFSVGLLSRFMEKPTQEHFNGVKRILRYVKGTKDYGLLYRKGDLKGELIGYSDSDFAGDCHDRKSTSGHFFLFGGMAVSWSSQKQSIVALSSCEAEYIAATSATCQAVWMNRLIGELTGDEELTVKLLVDNQSAITLARIQATIIAQNTSTLAITSFVNV